MGANESHDDVPSQDNTSHGESPTTYAAPSEDKDFYGESLSPYAAPSEDKDFYGESLSPYAAPSEEKDFYQEAPSLYTAPSEDEDFYGESQSLYAAPSEEEDLYASLSMGETSNKPLPESYAWSVADPASMSCRGGTDRDRNAMIRHNVIWAGKCVILTMMVGVG